MEIPNQTIRERFLAAHSTLHALLKERGDLPELTRIDALAETIANWPDGAPEIMTAIEIFETGFAGLVRLTN
jgi:hypothetical protein